jgi:hypothetical protein
LCRSQLKWEDWTIGDIIIFPIAIEVISPFFQQTAPTKT